MLTSDSLQKRVFTCSRGWAVLECGVLLGSEWVKLESMDIFRVRTISSELVGRVRYQARAKEHAQKWAWC